MLSKIRTDLGPQPLAEVNPACALYGWAARAKGPGQTENSVPNSIIRRFQEKIIFCCIFHSICIYCLR